MNKEKVKNLIKDLATELECDEVCVIDSLYSQGLIICEEADELEGLEK